MTGGQTQHGTPAHFRFVHAGRGAMQAEMDRLIYQKAKRDGRVGFPLTWR